MTDRRVTEDTAILGSAVATGDLFDLVDVSDTTDAASGTNKKILASELATAITTLGSLATDAEVTSAVAALSSVYQPLDADLTSIAALATTSFGRGFLILADASAARTAIGSVIGTDVEAHDTDLTTIAGLSPTNDDVLQRKSGAWANRTIAQLLTDLGLGALYQPLDSDLTAIAALSTTSTGRSLLAAADATAIRVIAGAVIGTDVQAYDVELAAIAGLTSATDRLPYFTGSGTAALATFTSAGRALVDDADASAQRTTLGVAIGTNVEAWDADLDAIAALTSAANKVAYATGAQTWALADYTAVARTFDALTTLLAQQQLLSTQAINAQSGTTYTLAASDSTKLVTLSNGSAITLTVPQDSDVTWAVGDYCEGYQLGAGQVTTVAGTGATLRVSGLTAKARAQYSRFFLQKVSANTWNLAGDLAAS